MEYSDRQLELYDNLPFMEDSNYLSNQLITYIGNKRTFLGQISKIVMYIKERIGKQYLRTFDGFSGSGIVSRFLKAHSSFIASNDLELLLLK